MYAELLKKEKTLAVIGLGYVGLPIALLFAKKLRVVGFDINEKRVAQMQQHIDPSGELPASAFEGCDITFTANYEDLKHAHFFVVGVPTPIDQRRNPDLTPVLSASRTLSKVLKPGDYVVYESTVYPGCTEEDCIPILEQSGLRWKQDFHVGYSPERINPGDQVHTLSNTKKIVSGDTPEAAKEIHDVYALIIEAGLHMASSIKVAEAAKIIENTQRDLNIALMNELSLIFDLMGINTYDVIEAAGTKWNFQKYQPGLVGGHCIGVDPYYLTYKSSELGYHAKVILAGRDINDSMGPVVGQKVVKMLIAQGKSIRDTRVLIMGITFKENVQDIRNSKVVDMYNELRSFMVNVEVVDPHAVDEEVHEEYGVHLAPEIGKDYDAIIVAVPHEEYKNLDESWFQSRMRAPGLLIDLKGLYRKDIKQLKYWSL
jgi:UDP-N-acetyl-D-galactosamine dehydrogenase